MNQTRFINPRFSKWKLFSLFVGILACFSYPSALADRKPGTGGPLNQQPWYPEFARHRDLMNSELKKSKENWDRDLICKHVAKAYDLILIGSKQNGGLYLDKYNYYSWRHDGCKKWGYNYKLTYPSHREAARNPKQKTLPPFLPQYAANNNQDMTTAEALETLRLLGGSGGLINSNHNDSTKLTTSDYIDFCEYNCKTYDRKNHCCISTGMQYCGSKFLESQVQSFKKNAASRVGITCGR
ncbi:hypothetical protein [Synechococcus sp. UW69]|uniref:hypothetical protein n=1 Tax=Synechococcus sp. UW69 TaxID=368493 RepID=UPI0010BE18D8|nr:hypothetical protein [Synechococcus sp. UW69]